MAATVDAPPAADVALRRAVPGGGDRAARDHLRAGREQQRRGDRQPGVRRPHRGGGKAPRAAGGRVGGVPGRAWNRAGRWGGGAERRRDAIAGGGPAARVRGQGDGRVQAADRRPGGAADGPAEKRQRSHSCGAQVTAGHAPHPVWARAGDHGAGVDRARLAGGRTSAAAGPDDELSGPRHIRAEPP